VGIRAGHVPAQYIAIAIEAQRHMRRLEISADERRESIAFDEVQSGVPVGHLRIAREIHGWVSTGSGMLKQKEWGGGGCLSVGHLRFLAKRSCVNCQGAAVVCCMVHETPDHGQPWHAAEERIPFASARKVLAKEAMGGLDLGDEICAEHSGPQTGVGDEGEQGPMLTGSIAVDRSFVVSACALSGRTEPE
jgi:hypothetical protein